MSENVPLLGGGGGTTSNLSSVSSSSRALNSLQTWNRSRGSSLCSGRRALTLNGAVDASARSLGVDAVVLLDTLATLGGSLDEPPSSAGSAQAVRELWDAALGTALPSPAAISPDWGYLGFQGTDPRSDLRSGSSNAALRLAVRALCGSAALRAEAMRGALGAGPPFALSVFNVVHVLVAHLHLLTPRGDNPPAFCPCCGASIRKSEYEMRAAQSHGGAALSGFIALIAEEMRGATLEPISYGANDEGFGSATGLPSLPPLLPGEAVLALLLETTILRLGASWRAAGRGEGEIIRASIDELSVSLREALFRGERFGMGDHRQLAFPRFLAEARAEVMGALANISRTSNSSSNNAMNGGNNSAGSGAKRSASVDHLWGGGLDFRSMSYRGAVEIHSPLESARVGAGGNGEDNTNTPLRAALRKEMRTIL
jgi:hypothetical protein